MKGILYSDTMVWTPMSKISIHDKFVYTYELVGKKEFMGEIQNYYRCIHCNEHVEEFLLYAHMEDHKNSEALFGEDALKNIPPEAKHLFKNNYDDETWNDCGEE